MADSMENLMKAIQRAEKDFGGDHRYRHVFGSLREARYAHSKVTANQNYDSPGQQEARQVATKVVIPDAVDSRNPNVPESPAGEGESGGEASA